MMMIAVDNKLPQPPNANWHDATSEAPPAGEQLVLTDATKTYAWLGYISDASVALPSLEAGGAVALRQEPAFWSTIAEQA